MRISDWSSDVCSSDLRTARWPQSSARSNDAAAGCLGLVVEADVARHDRIVERAARLAHPVEAAGDLPHDLGALRVREVEAVGDRDRRGADRGDVALRLGDRLLAARSEEHTSELHSLMRISYAVFCLNTK